jgi:2-amino-4-hydroxy-6-hydroxymethyldihydropteridine diphosphokinase
MNIAVISAGSNIDPFISIEKAKQLLAKELQCLTFSKNLKTKPVGFTDQPDFVNSAILIKTEKDMPATKSLLSDIEQRLGRIRTENKSGPRTIDLDIVVWNGTVVDNDVYTRDFLRQLIIEVLPEMKKTLSPGEEPCS